MIDWNDLRFFLAVAREGSTAAAARALRVNQSTVVRRVAALEEGLGVRLFNKNRDGYALTSEGEALMNEAVGVEASVQVFTRRAAALDGALTGSLRVTAAEGMALGFVDQLLNEFHHQHPEVQVNLIIENRYQDLSKGEADVALRAGAPGEGNLVGRKLSDQSWAVYGSRTYVEQRGNPATPNDLNAHRLVGFDAPLESILPARWLQSVAPRGEIACRSNSVLGLLFAIQSSYGLGLLPCQIGDRQGDLVRVIDPLPELTGDLWLLTHPDLHKQPKVRAFFDFMAKEIIKHRPLLLGQTRPLRGNVQHPPAEPAPDVEQSGSAAAANSDRPV